MAVRRVFLRQRTTSAWPVASNPELPLNNAAGLTMTHGTAYNVISVVSILVLGFLLFMALFQPSLKYKITAATAESLNSPDFFRMLEALTDS